MENRICMFTGHRDIAPAHVNSLVRTLDSTLEELIAEGYTDFRTGGAMGFDTLAAFCVLEKKKKYGFVRLHLYLPCHGQDRGWSDNMKAAYRRILSRADSVRYSYESYVNGCMQKRNREMVDGSELCVAYCCEEKGGTAYTVNYARKKGLKIINLVTRLKD